MLQQPAPSQPHKRVMFEPLMESRQRLTHVDGSTLLYPGMRPGYEAPPRMQQEVFLAKADECCVLFDFSDAGTDLEAKDMKLATLCELRDYVANEGQVITAPMYEKVVDVFAKNIFRSVPPATYAQSEIFDLEDEPVLEAGWPHMEIVYQLFLCVLRSPDFNATIAKPYVDTCFVHRLLPLFDCEDRRERDLLKTTLHCIYCKFLTLRPYIRQSINNIFFQFIYETEMFNGIAELLEILCTIISGFVLPLKEKHKTLLANVLLPLHKPRFLSAYHPQLAYCIVQFVEKDVPLTETVVLALLRYWPKVNGMKEVLFLREVEDILAAIDSVEFAKVQGPLFRQLARSAASPHSLVAEQVLNLWTCEHFCTLVTGHVETILPAMFEPLYWNLEHHWHEATRKMSCSVLTFLMHMKPQLFENCLSHYVEEGRQYEYKEDQIYRLGTITEIVLEQKG